MSDLHSFTNSSPSTTPPTNSSDDIWGDDEPGHTTEEVLSDLPAMRRQHMTDGYREGLSTGKAGVMQNGFDDGYPIGVRIGLRGGLILGILEGYLACTSISAAPELLQKVQTIYKSAKKELSIQNLLGSEDEAKLLAVKSIPETAEKVLVAWERKISPFTGDS